MKDRIKTGAVLFMMMIVMNSGASVQIQLFSNIFPSGYGCVAAEGAELVIVAFISDDSLLQLQKNYPTVYNQILQEFKNTASLHYFVEGNILLISFTSNSHKILAVYSTSGEFRHSIAYIGLAIPRMITEKLQKEYPAYSVYYGKKIRANNKNLYEVVIENKYKYRLINFIDAEMKEVKKLKK